MKHYFLYLIALISLSGLVACVGPGPVDPDDDRSIQRAVQTEVRDSPAQGAGSVSVDVEDGIVTLSGAVSDAAGVGDIVLRAERVPGVERVITDLEFQDGEETQPEQAAPPEEPVER